MIESFDTIGVRLVDQFVNPAIFLLSSRRFFMLRNRLLSILLSTLVVVFNAGAAVGLGRGDAQLQRRGLFGRHAGHIDFGPERFTQRRLHHEPPQPQGRRLRAPQACGGQHHPFERKTRSVCRALIQGMSPMRQHEAVVTARRRLFHPPGAWHRRQAPERRKSQQYQAYRSASSRRS